MSAIPRRLNRTYIIKGLIMERKEEIRDVLKSIKKEEWTIADYEFALEILSSDLRAIRNALDTLNQSAKTKDDIQKALDTIHDVLWKEGF